MTGERVGDLSLEWGNLKKVREKKVNVCWVEGQDS